MTSVLIADEHAVVRAGLRAALDRHPEEVRVVAEAASIDEAITRSRVNRPDVVLMGLRFLGDPRTGVDATRRIRALPQAPYVLVVTGEDTDDEIIRAAEAGASGYLRTDAPPADLLAAVTSAATGATALPPALAGQLRSRMASRAATLTQRELETLAAVATGMTNREVARTLYLSEAAVKSHLVQAFHKLGVKSRTAAVVRAREQGLLPHS